MTSKELYDVRMTLGLTQVELAELIGVNGTAISHMERGRRPITEYVEMKIERILRKNGMSRNPEILDGEAISLPSYPIRKETP